MNVFFITLAMIFLCSCQKNINYADYTNNPFQYNSHEYYLKANVINIARTKSITDKIVIDIGYRKILFNIKELKILTEKKNNFYFLKNNRTLIGVVNLEEEKYMGCLGETKELEKDFCSAFNSTEEYYMKLFTLTPDSLNDRKYYPAGNKWIIHNKGSWFKDVENIYIYNTNKLTAFRRDFKESADIKTKTELTIFHKMLSSGYLGIALTVSDEQTIESILSTLEIR